MAFTMEPRTEKNTRIEYLYRDAANWKKFNACVVRGTLAPYQIDQILGCLMDGEYFIPSKVGLTEEKFDVTNDDDHPYFELCREGFSVTEHEPTVETTAQEMLDKFLDIGAGGWEVAASQDILSGMFFDDLNTVAKDALGRGVQPLKALARLAGPMGLTDDKTARAAAMAICLAGYVQANGIKLGLLSEAVAVVSLNQEHYRNSPAFGPALYPPQKPSR